MEYDEDLFRLAYGQPPDACARAYGPPKGKAFGGRRNAAPTGTYVGNPTSIAAPQTHGGMVLQGEFAKPFGIVKFSREATNFAAGKIASTFERARPCATCTAASSFVSSSRAVAHPCKGATSPHGFKESQCGAVGGPLARSPMRLKPCRQKIPFHGFLRTTPQSPSVTNGGLSARSR